MATASLLNIGITGLRASQTALSTTGHNITNANTPGYTRQRVELTPEPGQSTGVGYIGAGVRVQDIQRITDEYVTAQLRLDTARSSESGTFLQQVSQLDNLLADEQTGLAPAMQSFFAALQGAASDPSSIPARRLVLSQGEALGNRFRALYERMEQQGNGVAGQLSASAARVTTLASSIAEANRAIQRAQGNSATGRPNDLLDKRDELIRQLAEQVDLRVVPQNDGQVNLFIGSGQGLVLGGESRRVSVDNSTGAVQLSGSGLSQDVTRLLSGGEMGGLLRFRDEALQTAFNSLGRLAMVFSQTMNAQHQKGVDLNGNRGGNLFADLNAGAGQVGRVLRLQGNANAALTVSVTDANQLTLSDYELSFVGPSDRQFEIVRKDDGAVVHAGAVSAGFPQSIEFDGVQLTFERGPLTQGDRFVLRPSHFGARDFALSLTAPAELALAAPVTVDRALGNRGSGELVSATVLQANSPALTARQLALTPPLAVRFTSATTYDVLDASDPFALKPLDPPLTGLRFIPGAVNDLLPGQLGITQAMSDGVRVGGLPAQPVLLSAADLRAGRIPVNGYLSESLRFSGVSSGVGSNTTQVRTEPGGSARDIGNQIAALSGVSARARTELKMTAFNDDGTGTPVGFVLNGVDLGVVNPPTLNQLATLVNGDDTLRSLGISAASDGNTLTLVSARGDDLSIAMRGDLSDSVQLLGANGSTLTLRGAGGGLPATVTGTANRSAGFDFRSGGPFAFNVSVDGGPAAAISLTNVFSTGVELAAGLQSAINASAIGPGRVTVSVNGAGGIELRTANPGSAGSLTISGAPVGSAIERALGISDGSAVGEDQFAAVTVGGSIAVTMAPGIRMTGDVAASAASIFRATPNARDVFLGYQVQMSGRPVAGDEFLVSYNNGGSADNRNGLALAQLETTQVVGGGTAGTGTATYIDSYGELVQRIGGSTSEARVEADSAAGLLEQSKTLRESISGVNLDEEAANLIRFEQYYNASARVISVARDLFDTLLGAVS